MIYSIVILDYRLGEVRVYHFNRFNKPEDPEAWVKGHDKEWKESQCYFMCGESLNVRYMDNKTGECLMEEYL